MSLVAFLQCPHNVHKLDGYTCDAGQVRRNVYLNLSQAFFLNILFPR